MNYYFQCRSNPKAPLFVTDERWEAEDMAKHPDFQRVDERGRLLQSTDEAFDNVRPAFVQPEPAVRKPLDVSPEDARPADEPFVAEDLY